MRKIEYLVQKSFEYKVKQSTLLMIPVKIIYVANYFNGTTVRVNINL